MKRTRLFVACLLVVIGLPILCSGCKSLGGRGTDWPYVTPTSMTR